MNVFTLPNPRPFEIRIAKKLDKNFLRNTVWRQFTNGEWFLTISMTPKSAVIMGKTEVPGDHLFQTLTLLDTLTRNGVKDITLVFPYFGYCRHDRAVQKGDHIPADLFTKLFTVCGASRILTVDLHSRITEKNSPVPFMNIDFIPELARALKKIWDKSTPTTFVSPDHGSRHRADQLRDLIDASAPVCWLEKYRDPKTGAVHAHELRGVKRGTTAIITDDILDTGGTIKQCVMRLKKEGFKTFYLAITHSIFSANAIQVIRALGFKKIFVSNTVPLSAKTKQALPIAVIDATPCILRALQNSCSTTEAFGGARSLCSK